LRQSARQAEARENTAADEPKKVAAKLLKLVVKEGIEPSTPAL
jgi:hypothetical protein